MNNIYEEVLNKKYKIDRIISLEKFRKFIIYASLKKEETIEYVLKNKKYFIIRERDKRKININAKVIYPIKFINKYMKLKIAKLYKNNIAFIK